MSFVPAGLGLYNERSRKGDDDHDDHDDGGTSRAELQSAYSTCAYDASTRRSCSSSRDDHGARWYPLAVQ